MNSTLANKAGFSSLYGDYSLDYPAVNSFGDIESIYSYFKYFGLALAIIGVISLIAYKISSDNDKKKKTKPKNQITKTLMILGSIGLIGGGGLFIYYLYAYFYLYLPQYRNFYSELPVEATEMLKKFN